MQVTATAITGIDTVRRCLESTMRSTPDFASRITMRQLYQCEHSPLRAALWLIELDGVKTHVSVHLVRHKIGVEHFVQSNRADRGGDKEADRDTPIYHTMLINAEALITMARKRLCYQASASTRYTMMQIQRAVAVIDSDLAEYMVPTCIYRGGHCPELRSCGNYITRGYRPAQITEEVTM